MRMNSSRSTNREMNSDTYRLRRQVMSFIYEAKRLLNGNLPRINIRITDVHDHRVLGEAAMSDNKIWIPASTVDRSDLRSIVFHEILHASFGIEHVDGCLLMDPIVQHPSRKVTDELFLQYSKGI